MKHDHYRELLALRAYGELNRPERSELEEHLAVCEDCGRFGAHLTDTLRALSGAPGAELPGDRLVRQPFGEPYCFAQPVEHDHLAMSKFADNHVKTVGTEVDGRQDLGGRLRP